MRSAATIARAIAALVLSLGVVVAATGWLYLLRAPLQAPGPQLRNALPLDELAKHSSVSLPLFVGVWSSAAILVALLARWARVERLAAALLLPLFAGGWAYAATGVSFLIVRQIPAADAFHLANGLRAVWIPALLAGAAGALLGRRRASCGSRAPLVLGVFLAAAGVVAVLASLLPVHGSSLFDRFAPTPVHRVAHALIAPLGVTLLVAARGLLRRKRRAVHVALAVLVPLALLHLVHGFGVAAVATALVALALVARRHDFTATGDPEARPRLVAWTAGALALVYAYGGAALWVNRVAADRPFGLRFALTETTRALVGLNIRGSAHLSGDFAEWFPWTVLLMGVGAAGALLHQLLAPWRFRHRQEERDHAVARALVTSWGSDTLAPFVLRADKSYFFGESESSFLAYRVVAGVAIVSGDPIGPPEEFDALVERFIAFARMRGWRIAILGASEARLELYRRHGLRCLYHGDEAVVDAQAFSLEGRAIRKVRQSQHRLRRAGYRAVVLAPAGLDDGLRAKLEEIARAWRGTEPERGFVMALDALFRVEDAVFVVGLDEDGDPKGFLHFAVSRAGSALSLSSMPRLRDTPNGFNEWLVCEAVEWARDNGFRRVSLNFAPFAALLAPSARLTRVQSVQKRALLALKGHFQLDNLLLFNRKFFPTWERRFVVYERALDLPRVGVAALAVEAYLPFTGRRP